MSVAVPPTGPDEFVTRLQNGEAVAGFDPGVAGFTQHAMRFTVFGIDKVEIELVLRAVENGGPDQAVAHPTEARDVGILGIGQADPLDRAAMGTDHPEPDLRVRVPNFGIFF